MSQEPKHPCAGRVHEEFGVGFRDCSRSGKYREGGKWWCAQHYPSKVKARNDARQKEWDDQQKRDATRDRRRYAEQHACAGIPTDSLEAGVVAALLEACEAALAELADLRPPNVKAAAIEGCQNPHIAERLRAAIAKAKKGMV